MIKDFVLGTVVLAFLGWLMIYEDYEKPEECMRTDGCRIVDGVMIP